MTFLVGLEANLFGEFTFPELALDTRLVLLAFDEDFLERAFGNAFTVLGADLARFYYFTI